MGISRIPMPQNGMDAFLTGMTQSQSIFNSLMKNKLSAAQASAIPSEINLRKAQASEYPSLIQLNQANASAVPSEINLRNAQASGIPSEINLRNSQVGLNSQDALKQKILNETLHQREQAEIGEIGARSNYYNQGGGRGGVSQATERAFENSVLADNPQITDPDKQREAINVLTSGGNKLSDGTQLNPMSDITKRAYDRAFKTTTTAQAVNQGLQANQAATEMPPITDAINDGLKEYGNVAFGKSPQQIKDALDTNNPAAQLRLGKYIAAQQLLYDRSALMLKINGLPPGQRIASKISDLAMQTISANYPTLSAQARKNASDIVSKTLTKVLEARNKYGVGASGAAGKKGNQSQQLSDPLGLR